MTDTVHSLADDEQRWRQENEKKLATVRERRSLIGRPLDVLYAPRDGEVDAEDYRRDIGLPGEFPYTRGVYPAMYRDRLWQMRLYSGFGDAENTNERWRFLLSHGNNGVSAAFDLPTQVGLDSDAPEAGPEAGRVGVAVDCVRDFERMFDGLQWRRWVSRSTRTAQPPSYLRCSLPRWRRKDCSPTRSMAP